MLEIDPARVQELTAAFIGRVGDVIVATPLLRSLRERFPQTRIRLLVSYRSAGVLPLIPFVDDWAMVQRAPRLPGHLKLAWQLLSRRCDLFVDLNPSFSKTSSLLARAVRAPLRVGFAKGRLESSFTHTIPPPGEREHMLDRYERLARLLGAPWRPELELALSEADQARSRRLLADLRPEGDGKFWVVLHPGNFDRFSFRWPEDKFVELTDRLLGDPALGVCYLSGPGEEPHVRGIVARLKKPAPIWPVVPLGVLGGLLQGMDLAVLNITGTLHLAAALQVPTFGFYAGYTQAVWRARGEAHGGTVCPEWESCRETTVDEAYEALRAHIARLRGLGGQARRVQQA